MSTNSQSSLSPAVLHCWTAYQQTFAIERGKGVAEPAAFAAGKMAYRQAMPCLSDQNSIRDFVACVTHGMVLTIIPNDDGGKLLYAANVAAGFLRQEQKLAQTMAQKITQQSSQNGAQTPIGPSKAVAA
jgi:hypothetical protein